MALTLLGKAADKTADPSKDGGGGEADPPPPPLLSISSDIKAVQVAKSAAEPERQLQFIDSRIHTMNVMREKEMQRISQLTKDFTLKPSETLQSDLDIALKRVKQLQEQIFVLSMRRNATASSTPPSPRGRTSQPSLPAAVAMTDRPLPPLPGDNVAAPVAGRVSRRSSTVSNHSRQLSTPEPLQIAAAQLSLPADTSAFNQSMDSLPTIAGAESSLESLSARAKKPPDGRQRVSI